MSTRRLREKPKPIRMPIPPRMRAVIKPEGYVAFYASGQTASNSWKPASFKVRFKEGTNGYSLKLAIRYVFKKFHRNLLPKYMENGQIFDSFGDLLQRHEWGKLKEVKYSNRVRVRYKKKF